MAEQSWFGGGVKNGGVDSGAAGGDAPSFFAADGFRGDGAAPPPVPRRDAAYELRPLTTGEVLDRTFFLYRNNFWLFTGLSAIAAGISVVTSIVQQVYLHFSKAGPTVTKAGALPAFAHLGVVFGMGAVAAVLYLVVYSLTQAATVSAVTAIYLGDTTSIAQAWRSVTERWYRYPLIALWQFWSGAWLYLVLVAPAFGAIMFLARHPGGAGGTGTVVVLSILMFVGVIAAPIYGVIAYIRNSLAVPAEVMERLTIRAAMKRSKVLAAGSKGRIFLLFLMLGALYVVVGAVEIPFAVLITKTRGMQVVLLQSLLLFVNFFVTTLVGPVAAIGLCLFYIDQRVRKEGFDIEFLIERNGGVVAVNDGIGLP